MGLNIIESDILTIQYGIICHQVNCQGVMGAGLAKGIKEAFPQAFLDYMKAYRRDQLQLGNVIETQISDKIYVASMCGQEFFGRDRNRVYTDYQAFQKCLTGVNLLQSMTKLPVFFPYMIGCGLANGNWQFISQYIETLFPVNAFIIKHL